MNTGMARKSMVGFLSRDNFFEQAHADFLTMTEEEKFEDFDLWDQTLLDGLE